MFEHDASFGKVLPNFSQAVKTYKVEGFKAVVMFGLQFIYIRTLRKLLPGTSYTRYVPGIDLGDILINRPRKILDGLFPRFKLNPYRELGLRLAHTCLTRPGDKVVIIGGGEGLTAVLAGKIVGGTGSVHVYDGLTGEDNQWFGVSKILGNAKLNNVANVVTAEWAFVTPREHLDDFDLYKKEGTVPPVVHPENLPDCDVLEMDANGAELEILETMTIRPRVLIFELEAPFYKGYFKHRNRHPLEVLKLLNQLGYSVIKQTGHEGINLTQPELLELVERQYESENKVTLENGAKDSPVLYCVRNDVSLATFQTS